MGTVSLSLVLRHLPAQPPGLPDPLQWLLRSRAESEMPQSTASLQALPPEALMGVAPGTSGDTLGCHTGEGHSSWHVVVEARGAGHLQGRAVTQGLPWAGTALSSRSS